MFEYTYDDGGNILSVTKDGEEIKDYTYGDTSWKDLLTQFNGQTITYDNIGNPLTYLGKTLTWENGRQLSTIGNNISYTYNADGNRISKTVNGTTTEYFWLDGVLLGEKTGTNTILYLYDDNGVKYGFDLNGTRYYYILNLQGDVIGILDSAGVQVVSYTYDAWGNLLSTTGTLADTVGQINPIRYRGYYYDAETEFYFLNSRYYDPETGRFINADGLVDNRGLITQNLFQYCGNNPIDRMDPSGQVFIEAAALYSLAKFALTVIGATAVTYTIASNPSVQRGFTSLLETIAIGVQNLFTPSKSETKDKTDEKDTVTTPPVKPNTYYHVTSISNAQKIMSSSVLVPRTEKYVYAWKKKPNIKAVKKSGAYVTKPFVIIAFETNMAFEPDLSILDPVARSYMPVRSVFPGSIPIYNARIVG